MDKIVSIAPRTPMPPTDRGRQVWLQNLKPGPAREWIRLGGGLVLLLETSGLKTWQARFRLTGSRQERRMTIGHFPRMSLADARLELERVKSAVRDGEDPALERKRAAAGTAGLHTLDDLADAYLERRKGAVAAKTLKGEREQLAVIRAELGDRRLQDIEGRDIAAAVDGYLARLKGEGRAGTSANKVLAVTKRMFNACREWGLLEGGNPAAGLKRRVKERPRERVLVDGALLVEPARPKLNETGMLMAALLDEPSPIWGERSTRVALALSLLLGFRAEEVCALRWADVILQGDQPQVTVGKSKTAAGLRTLPLPPLAAALLAELHGKAAKKATLVFPARDEEGRTPYMHPESLSRSLARAAEKLGLEGLTHHDLRRTLVTGLGELGFEGVAGRIAGHAAKGVTGRHYDHSRRLPAMRAALLAWEGAVVEAMERHPKAVENAPASA